MQKNSEDHTNVRGLARLKTLANALCIICLVFASAMLVVGLFSAGPSKLLYYYAALGLDVVALGCQIVREVLKTRIRNAYFDSPLGVFFTGSLYRSKDLQLLPGLKEGTHASCTRLSRNPYPDGVAIGANGVVKTWNEVAWFALLVSVNGRVNVTRICQAEYGWQAFVKEKIY